MGVLELLGHKKKIMGRTERKGETWRGPPGDQSQREDSYKKLTLKQNLHFLAADVQELRKGGTWRPAPKTLDGAC
jgi:hypothetical protein